MSKNEIVSMIETMNNYDELASKAKAKADAIRDAGKSHLQHDAAAGSGSNEIELSNSEMEKMRSFWPHASDEEIRKMAKKVASFRKKV